MLDPLSLTGKTPDFQPSLSIQTTIYPHQTAYKSRKLKSVHFCLCSTQHSNHVIFITSDCRKFFNVIMKVDGWHSTCMCATTYACVYVCLCVSSFCFVFFLVFVLFFCLCDHVFRVWALACVLACKLTCVHTCV